MSEVTYKRKADFALMNRNPHHSLGRSSVGRPRSSQGPTRNRDLIGHTTEESEVGEAPITRGQKSFSVMSLPRDQRDGPPAYDGGRYMAKSADNLDRIYRPPPPLKGVTSLMSHDTEYQNRRNLRYNEGPHPRSRAPRPAGSIRKSRDRVDYNDDSSSPPQSPSRPNYDDFSYAPDIRKSKRQPRSGSFRRALELNGNPRDSDESSKFSDRASSSSNDHRDTRVLVKPNGKRRIQYDEEPGRRRTPKLSLPHVSERPPGNRYSSSPPSRLRGPPSPPTPVSPAPSYHVTDPMLHSKRSPVPSRGSSRDAEFSDYFSDGRNPPVKDLDMNAYNNDNFNSSEPHISSYSSFV